MKKMTVLLLALALLLLAAQAQALTITPYTSQDDWIAAVGGNNYLMEKFDDNILHDPGLTYTTVMGSIALERWRDVLNVTSNNPAQTTWQFVPQITAYGGTWTLGGPGGSGNSLVITIAELSGFTKTLSSSYNGDFWGFVTDTPFSQVTLNGGLGSNQRSYFLDDMVYSPVLPSGDMVTSLQTFALLPAGLTAPAAPLPGAVYLLGTGLLAIFLRRQS